MYVCFFIVCFGFRWQQRTFSNTYHSSVAYERSTGDPAIGLGFGAAALRSNVSYICLLVYISHTSFSDLLSNKIKRLDRRKELNSVTRHISDLCFFVLSSYLIFHFFYFFVQLREFWCWTQRYDRWAGSRPGHAGLKKEDGGPRRRKKAICIILRGTSWSDVGRLHIQGRHIFHSFSFFFFPEKRNPSIF